jgi:DnaJ-class molecular chaperone
MPRRVASYAGGVTAIFKFVRRQPCPKCTGTGTVEVTQGIDHMGWGAGGSDAFDFSYSEKCGRCGGTGKDSRFAKPS